jgi:hypothetical protein
LTKREQELNSKALQIELKEKELENRYNYLNQQLNDIKFTEKMHQVVFIHHLLMIAGKTDKDK